MNDSDEKITHVDAAFVSGLAIGKEAVRDVTLIDGCNLRVTVDLHLTTRGEIRQLCRLLKSDAPDEIAPATSTDKVEAAKRKLHSAIELVMDAADFVDDRIIRDDFLIMQKRLRELASELGDFNEEGEVDDG